MKSLVCPGFSLFLLEAFRLTSSAKYRLASLVQFQAASQLPAPYVENQGVTQGGSDSWGVELFPSSEWGLAAVGRLLADLEKSVCWREPLVASALWDCLPAQLHTESIFCGENVDKLAFLSLFLFGVRERWSLCAARSTWISRKIWICCCEH